MRRTADAGNMDCAAKGLLRLLFLAPEYHFWAADCYYFWAAEPRNA